MGLRLLMRDGESHPIFEDELFGESQAWILSTSGLSAGDRFYGTGASPHSSFVEEGADVGTQDSEPFGLRDTESTVRFLLLCFFSSPLTPTLCRPCGEQDHQVWNRVEAVVRRNLDGHV